MTWQALLVDDERLARRELRSLLAAHREIEVVGEAATVDAAVERLRLTGATLIFLDVQLKGESGFDLLPRIAPDIAVIFVTAHDQYAVRAFDVHAVDYLLKPVEPTRLAAAIAQLTPSARRAGPARETARGDAPLDRPPLRGAIRSEPSHADPAASDDGGSREPLVWSSRLFLRMDDRMGFLAVAQIRAVLADGDHAIVVTRDGRRVHVRKPLREWIARLPDAHFLQIHRGALVNLEDVTRVDAWSHGSYLVHLRGSDAPLTMSRRFAARVRARLG